MKSSNNNRIAGTSLLVRSHQLFEMSNIDLDSHNRLFQSFQHSHCAALFHSRLKETTEIDAVATYAYGNLALASQMVLKIWVKDSLITEAILKNMPYQSFFDSTEPLFQSIIESLLFALKEDNNQMFSNVSALWEKQKESDGLGEKRIYVGIELYSYLRCYIDELLSKTKTPVTHAIKDLFPDYEQFECYAFSLKSGPIAHNHLFLFLTPQDKDKAIKSGDFEKMRKTAYSIITKNDVFGYISYEDYNPQIESKRFLSSKQIFFINRE